MRDAGSKLLSLSYGVNVFAKERREEDVEELTYGEKVFVVCQNQCWVDSPIFVAEEFVPH